MKNSQPFLMTLLLTVILFSAGNLFAEKTLYDDFSTGYLDGKKWFQRTYVREILDGQFVSKLGNRSPGMGAEVAPGVFRNNLSFAPPTAPKTLDDIKIIECEITIVEAKLDSATDSKSFTRIAGYFYSKNETGGATGDIFSHIMIGDQGNGKLEAFWEVQEMLSDDTRTWSVIGSGTISDFDTSIIDPPYKAKISYDGDRTFSFIVNDLYTDSYIGPIRKRAAVTPWKGISTGINATNGSNNGYVSAKFDNVKINDETSVYDNFSSDLIDPAKWRSLEFVRETSGGKLRMNVQACDDVRGNGISLAAYDTRYIKAKVLIESGSQVPSGNQGWVRIAGWYYNDSRGPGSGLPYNGYEGDVWVSNRLIIDSDGQLKALAGVQRIEDADGTTGPILLWQTFPTSINFNTEYILSIKFTGSSIIFECNNDTLTYQVTTPIYEPSEKWLGFQSRVYVDPDECGYIKGRIDDVFVYKVVKLSPGIPLLLLND